MENLQNTHIDIPMDMYQSATEILIIIPLWWITKESIKIILLENKLIISGNRVSPVLNEKYVVIHDQCFWGGFEKKIDLPQSVYFDKIYSELSPDNVLSIVVPKLIIPEQVPVVIKL
mgnify:CR=1 FL=1